MGMESLEQNSEKITITKEDRKKVSHLVKKAKKEIVISKAQGKNLEDNDYSLFKSKWTKFIGKVIGIKKAEIIIKEIEEEKINEIIRNMYLISSSKNSQH